MAALGISLSLIVQCSSAFAGTVLLLVASQECCK
jgi:hypothetical protein